MRGMRYAVIPRNVRRCGTDSSPAAQNDKPFSHSQGVRCRGQILRLRLRMTVREATFRVTVREVTLGMTSPAVSFRGAEATRNLCLQKSLPLRAGF